MPLVFGSFSRLIDALMLFGASIEALPNRNYRLSLQRAKAGGAALVWAVIVTESQDPLFDFLQFHVTMERGSLRCRTRTTRFLEDSYQRWYRGGVIKMPDDVAVDDRAVLFWLLGSWAVGDKPITLPLLGASEALTSRLVEEVKDLSGWCVGTGKGHLTLAGRPWIENWLKKKGVPERVWK